jgi:hypothetical protein
MLNGGSYFLLRFKQRHQSLCKTVKTFSKNNEKSLESNGRCRMKKGVLFTVIVMVLCVLLVPLTVQYFGRWLAYWSHAALSIIFALAAFLLKTKWFWEEE